MLSTTPLNLRQLEQRLTQQTDDFLITGDCHNPQQKTFTFIGHLHGKAVIWNTRLNTLQSLAQHHQYKQLQQFIHIQQEQNNYRLEIGLYLKQIDPVAIKRTIIMIRQYKNLRNGRHNYGPIYNFTY